MLNIQPVSFKNNYNYSFKNNINSYNAPKLRPLAKDTISFKGERELTDIRTIVKDSDANFEEIYQNASVAESKLKKTLNRAFNDLIVSDTNPDGIIEPIIVRTKTAESIEEKVISILAEAVKQANPSSLFKIENSQSIKQHVDDIVGARIILNESDPKVNAPIVESLIGLIRNKELKIKKVEMIVPAGKDSITPYFDVDDVKRIVAEANLKRNPNNPIEYKQKESKTGYSALHIDLDLSDKNLRSIYDGYNGEIQIMGSDVAKLKDIEDLCYKIKQDKSIVGRHPAYFTFVNHLNKYFKSEDPNKTPEENKEISEQYKAIFKEYTYRAYIIQRKKTKDSPNSNVLPTLKECGMDGKLPDELDFNYLKKIKESCDKIYELSKKNKVDDDTVMKMVIYGNRFLDILKEVQNPTARNQFFKPINDLYRLTCDN